MKPSSPEHHPSPVCTSLLLHVQSHRQKLTLTHCDFLMSNCCLISGNNCRYDVLESDSLTKPWLNYEAFISGHVMDMSLHDFCHAFACCTCFTDDYLYLSFCRSSPRVCLLGQEDVHLLFSLEAHLLSPLPPLLHAAVKVIVHDAQMILLLSYWKTQVHIDIMFPQITNGSDPTSTLGDSNVITMVLLYLWDVLYKVTNPHYDGGATRRELHKMGPIRLNMKLHGISHINLILLVESEKNCSSCWFTVTYQ